MDIKYYSVPQVAEMFSVAKCTVREWILDGKINAIKIGNRFRISHDDLTKFANERYYGDKSNI